MSKQTVYVVLLSDPYAEHLCAVFDSHESATAWIAGVETEQHMDEKYRIIPMPVVQWLSN